MEFITKSTQETQEAGEKLALSLIEEERSNLIAGLTGDLGSGKTTFTQGFAKGLGVNARIISPTFILMRNYPVDRRDSKIESFYHVDLYRLEENVEEEVRNLGVFDMWKKAGNVFFIEWAEKVKDAMPESSYWITFENLGADKRKIKINH